MQLYTWLLPFYISGNLHCFGMCGPLAFMLAKQKYRCLYLVGRIVSFALAGFLSGLLGQGLGSLLEPFQIPRLLSLGMSCFFLALGFHELGISPSYMPKPIQAWLSRLSLEMAIWVQKGKPSSLFLFGLATILLPCGQSWMLFSALALYADSLSGAFNGAIFALCTSPSLYLAMVLPSLSRQLPTSWKKYSKYILASFWWLSSGWMFYRFAQSF